jgi:uncharacterized membrane protein
MAQQSGNLSSNERTVSTLIGSALALFAARRGNPLLRAVAGAAGGALLARAYAGHCGMKAALSGQTTLAGGLSDQWHRMTGKDQQSDTLTRAAQSNAVDESVEQSFPASDPPASHLPDDPPSNAEAKWAAARTAGT